MAITTALSKTEFLEILKKSKVTVIKAGATWCGPCKRIVADVEKIVETLSKDIQVIYLDVDDSGEVSAFLRIKKLPTFISYVGEDKMDILVSSNMVAIKKFFQKAEAHAGF